MKILFITHGDTHYKNVNAMSGIADELEILGFEKYKEEIVKSINNPPKDNIKISYEKSLIRFILKPRKIKADLVIAHCPISGLSAVLSKKPFVFLMCQDFYEYYELFPRPFLEKKIKLFLIDFMTKLACKKAKKVICLSTYIEKKAKEYGAKKTHIIPLFGVDMALVSPKNNNPNLKKELGIKNQKVLVTNARLSPEKGLQYLIRAVKILEKENIILLIIGRSWEDEEKRLKDLVKRLGLENKIKFLGTFPFKEIPHFYNISDVCLLVSLKEGLGFTAAEPLACLKPIIGSNTGGIPDIVIHNKTGLLVEPGNSQQIADAIILLLKDKKLRDKLVKQGYNHIKEKFEEKKVVDAFREAILK
ncbi:MAG: glycosyltransferase family 4 protein [Candidatus Nanoarchaeia archaeon]|nr:glycosyltransferase family 4 protein [Candidatus Nanoarchaeia archaeon]